MSANRHIYLKMKSAPQAREILLDRAAELPPMPAETMPTTDALGRIIAAPIYARASSPVFPAAAMDGYAVQSALTFGASEANPVTLSVPDEAEAVDTGDALPSDKDAVYKIEDVQEQFDSQRSSITVLAAAWPGQHVRLVGEEVTAGELLVASGQQLAPRYIGLLLAAQIWSVPVRRKPSVTLIPTGSECVPAGQQPSRGQFVEYNGPMLSAALTEWGAQARLLSPVADNPEVLCQAIEAAVQDSDLIVLIAGSSAGSEDFVPRAIAELGQLLVHGVQMMPGKPLALGWISDTPVVGLPGYCVAAWMGLTEYIRPLICHLLRTDMPQRERVSACLCRKLPSTGGIKEILRVALCDGGDCLTAVPLSRGSGSISSLARAHGLLSIEPDREGLEAGAEIDVELLIPREEIKRSIVAIGSHDLALSVVAEQLAQHWPPLKMIRLSTGSTEGLSALGRGEGHLAGTHLLDPETEEYNVSYLLRWLPDLPLILVNLTFREVGLLVARGNPKTISSIDDLAREEVAFINRQRGSGTRVLLDFLLDQHNIAATALKGYQREAYTHTMIAEAIRHGSADVGLGIRAAAHIFGLDFVPVTEERYDLVIPKSSLALAKLDSLLELLHESAFHQAVGQLGGYSTRNTGELIYEQ